MTEYKVGYLVYHDKYHRGPLKVVEVHDWYVIVGKYSRIGLRKTMIRHSTAQEIESFKNPFDKQVKK